MKKKISKKILHSLFNKALKASRSSYSPYSHFPVGAALLVGKNKVITGANIENRSYGLTLCAERVAVTRAVFLGYKKVKAIAIAAPKGQNATSPCGACRQVLSEFYPPSTPIIYGKSYKKAEISTLGALYPKDSLQELKGK